MCIHVQFLLDFKRLTGVDADEAFLSSMQSLCEPISRICVGSKASKKILEDHEVVAGDAEAAVCK